MSFDNKRVGQFIRVDCYKNILFNLIHRKLNSEPFIEYWYNDSFILHILFQIE